MKRDYVKVTKAIIPYLVHTVKRYDARQRFVFGFFVVVAILALTRLFCPSVAQSSGGKSHNGLSDSLSAFADSAHIDSLPSVSIQPSEAADTSYFTRHPSKFFDKEGKEVKNRIFSVPHFGKTFPDENDVQLLAAQKYGVQPVLNREDAEKRKSELVYIGSNPYFYVDKLNNSIAYLVPRASVLLQDIGKNFYDSLQVKGLPLHKIIVTSVLRTKDDVEKLSRRNQNAKPNSCHLYGTTFDICYNRYKTVEAQGDLRRKVQNDTLKWILSEVLRDVREQNRALVKYEVKQGCFHITVR